MRLSVGAILAAAVLFAFPGMAAASEEADDEPPPSHLNLSGFLDEMNLTFEEYMTLMDEFEYSGIYPHFLRGNTVRYAQYRNLNPHLYESTVIALVNAKVDIEHFRRISEVPDPNDIALLVNKHHRLPIEYEPSDLVAVPWGHRMREEAAEAFALMREEMLEHNLRLHVVSTYRSGVRQESMHRNSVRRIGLERTDQDLARGGHSEHQTGLTVDFLHRGHSGLLSNARFQDTEQFAWLLDNAHRYGFILRYPEGLTHITGYIFEPWHWRYVGVEIATEMYERGIATFEEFFGKYLAPEVLHNVRWLIWAQRAAVRGEENARRRAEERIRLAEEEAALAIERAAQAAATAAAMVEGRLAMIEAELLLALEMQEAARIERLRLLRAAIYDALFVALLAVSACLLAVIVILAYDTSVSEIIKRRTDKAHDSCNRLQGGKLAERLARYKLFGARVRSGKPD